MSDKLNKAWKIFLLLIDSVEALVKRRSARRWVRSSERSCPNATRKDLAQRLMARFGNFRLGRVLRVAWVTICFATMLVIPEANPAQTQTASTAVPSFEIASIKADHSRATLPSPRIKPAVDGVLDLFNQKAVVALGDYHGLAQEEAFYIALIRDPEFAEKVGNVVVEFGGESAQDIIDRYVAGEDVPLTELRRIWTDTAGWFPGPTSLGYVNFFATVRAANLKLPPDHRIKVWLGDASIDWSKINSFRDLQPYLAHRDDNMFRIITDEIVKKHKKLLVIVGSRHLFGPKEVPTLSSKIDETYPNMLADVEPFIGYIEPSCNAKFVGRAKDWPVPAVVGPVGGTWLKSELSLPGCNFISPATVERIKNMPKPPAGARWTPPSLADRIALEISIGSGAHADAILYLGPPDTLAESPIDPNIYLDPDYFKEENRRQQFCNPFGEPLDWDQILQQESLISKKLQVSR